MIGIKHKLEYADLAHAPDDGQRYELLDGNLYVTPSPSPLHQRVSKRLQRGLEDYFEARGLGEVFAAPLDVILTNRDVVEPDLLVVTDPGQISGRAIEGPPTLVFEILSPSTRDRDRTLKARRYAELGVRHYWIVDVDRHRIECYRAEGSTYALATAPEGDATLIHPDWPELAIPLAALWR